MNKNSFLEALRNIFKKARVADVESIIEVYEEHFAIGYELSLIHIWNPLFCVNSNHLIVIIRLV